MAGRRLVAWRRVGLAFIASALAVTSLFMSAPPQAKALENGTYTGVPCDSRVIVWGRPECYSYYQGVNDNLQNTGVALFDNGEFMKVKNAPQFIQVVRKALNEPNNPKYNTVASAIVNLMLRKPGTDFGTTAKGVDFARNNFDRWVALVNAFDSAGLIEYDYVYSPNGAFHNSGYNEKYNDIHTHRVFYDDTLLTIRFNVPPGGSGEAFMIDKFCGNLKGGGDFPSPPQFQINGNTTIDGNDQNSGGAFVTGKKLIYATPGSTVTFNHTLQNAGGAAKNVSYTATAVAPNGSKSNAPATPMANPGSINLNPGNQATVNSNQFTIPANATPGQRYCQYVTYSPVNGNDNGPGGGAAVQACVEVAYNYNLVPAASASETLTTSTDTVTFTYNVNNSGQTTSNTTNWTIQQLVVTPGTTINSNPGYTDGASCATYVKPGVTCSQLQSGTGTYNPGNTSISPNPAAASLTLSGYPAGTKICRVLTVDPPTQNANPRNRWSSLSCVLVGKYPTVHFMSGDISVGGAYPNAAGACVQRNNSGNVYTAANANNSGSVDEYAAFVRGKINHNAASKKGFGTGSLVATDSQRIIAWRLAFANTNNPAGNLGDTPHCMNDYYARFSPQSPAVAAPSPVDLGAIGASLVHYNGDITIAASTIPAGKSLIVVVDGNVTITGDITYPANYGSVADIPSIAIVAKGNITVNDTVKRLDGSYSTRGTFATCQINAGLSTNICKDQLVINGAVYTDKLSLPRTFGADSGASSTEPAERFIYGVELLYNNVLEPAGSGGRIDVVNEQDLPPRF